MDLDSLHYPPGLCPRNELFIDQVRSSKDHCYVCKLPWEPESIRVKQKSRAYHLACFRPDNQMRIYGKDVKMTPISERNTRSFEKWLERYNSDFRTVNGSDLERYSAKWSQANQRRRELLEIFKFCTVKECAAVLSLVSAHWRTHSLDVEVWEPLLARTYPLVQTTREHPRDTLILTYYLSCYACKELFQQNTEIITRHPVSGQPLCEKCFPRQFYNKVSVDSYCEYLGVTTNYMKASGVRIFQVNFRSFVMPFEVRARITEYRRQRLKQQCESLIRDESLRSELESLDPDALYHLKDIRAAIDQAKSEDVKMNIRKVFLQEDVMTLALPSRSLKRKSTPLQSHLTKLRKVSRN